MAFSLPKLCWNPFSRMSGNVPCLSRPTNIIAGLFLLGALGWIITRVTGLNSRSIVPFSEVGNKALRLFWQVFSSSQKQPPKDTKTETVAPPKNREIALIPANSSNEQLLKMIVFVQGKDGKLDLDDSQKNKEIYGQLKKRIQGEFAQHANKGEDQLAKALAPLFALFKNDSDRFTTLVYLVVQVDRFSLHFKLAVLEKIEWPSEQLKQEKLPTYLASYIVDFCIDWQDDSIEIEAPSSSKDSTFFRTYRLVVNTKAIFGCGNFVTTPKPLSPFLAEGMGSAIQRCAQAAMMTLKKTQSKGTIDDRTNVGLNLVITQFHECRFPSSMVAPILPHLKNVPGLVGLEMSDVGGSGLVTTESGQESGHGFRDEDAPALLDLFRTNPYLFHVKININGMAPERQTQFLKDWESILKTRRKPTIGDLLALEAPQGDTSDSDNE